MRWWWVDPGNPACKKGLVTRIGTCYGLTHDALRRGYPASGRGDCRDRHPGAGAGVGVFDRLANALCQERARADAAEARCEELRWAEVDARAQAGSYKGLLDRCREKLEATRDELKRVCRTAKNALGLEAEVERLQSLLRDAGVDPRKRATVISLRMEVARLTAELGTEQEKTRRLEQQKAALEKEVEALRSTRSVLSKACTAPGSEQQKKPKSDRPRGQQKDKPGHGRTARPDLEKKEERHDPPENARLCSCCGKPYVANGDRASEVIEIEVKAHVRRIVRGRPATVPACPAKWSRRRRCGCLPARRSGSACGCTTSTNGM